MTSLPGRAFLSFLLFAVLGAASFSTVSAQDGGTSVTVELKEFEGSGISGTAVLTEKPDGGTHVSMELQGEELAGNHPTHIHTGTCSNFNPNPLYPLQTVDLSPVNQEGVSETDVDDASPQSLREGDFVILVHKSPEEITEYLVCGEISGGTVEELAAETPATEAPATEAPAQTKQAEAKATAPAHHMPVAGVGVGVVDTWSESSLLVAFAGLAIVSALGATALRVYRK